MFGKEGLVDGVIRGVLFSFFAFFVATRIRREGLRSAGEERWQGAGEDKVP